MLGPVFPGASGLIMCGPSDIDVVLGAILDMCWIHVITHVAVGARVCPNVKVAPYGPFAL